MVRGRECLLERDLKRAPLTYSASRSNHAPISGTIENDDELNKVFTRLQEYYETRDFLVALRRIGRGVCPKSFPITKQSHYFLELFRLTHGGEYGVELMRLPASGGVLEQPAIFFQASDIIRAVKIRHIHQKINKENASKDNIPGGHDSPRGYR